MAHHEVSMIYGTVACIGDSLTAGARAPLGYPELLPQLLVGQQTEWATRNFGVSGETTRQILDRTPAAIAWLNAQAGAKRAIILAGTNDSKAEGLPLQQWEQLYRQLLHWPRRHGIPITLCTFPPVEPVSREMPAYTNASRAWLASASQRVRAIATELDCNPSPVNVCDLSHMPVSYLCDGVHLTQDGYRWMAEQIAVAIGYNASMVIDAKRKPKRKSATVAEF
jgi:lysophospholipase L1-like esterase